MNTTTRAMTLMFSLFLFGCSSDESFAAKTPPALPAAMTALEFGPDATLFVADPVRNVIHAIDVSDSLEGRAVTEPLAFNLTDFGEQLAAKLEVDEASLRYYDVAVHAQSQVAFLSLGVQSGTGEEPYLASITLEGDIEILGLDNTERSTTSLEAPPDAGITFMRDVPASTLVVTDLDYSDGVLYVSGLSTGEFASTLRQIPYPFGNDASRTSIEMFHAAHGQQETRAPIRAMTLVDIDGKKTIVAAYTCTPLVTIDVDDLEDGAHVNGKTIAELGYGNQPLDILSFDVYGMDGKAEPYVLVINRDMGAKLLSLSAIAESDSSPGLSAPVAGLGFTAGTEHMTVPLSGVVQVADQNPQFLLALKRNLERGTTELLSYRKGSYMRISEFQSEYNFPDYEYAEGQEFIRQFQNQLKADEGYTTRVRN
ncbi:MAG: hypothetical protein AAFX56_06260 [Pseudomonadota bacterium]